VAKRKSDARQARAQRLRAEIKSGKDFARLGCETGKPGRVCAPAHVRVAISITAAGHA